MFISTVSVWIMPGGGALGGAPAFLPVRWAEEGPRGKWPALSLTAFLPPQMPVCSYFLKGICSNSNCPYSHVYVSRRAEVCTDFLKGYCPLGAKVRGGAAGGARGCVLAEHARLWAQLSSALWESCRQLRS